MSPSDTGESDRPPVESTLSLRGEAQGGASEEPTQRVPAPARSASHLLPVGTTLGRYIIIRVVGEGGMGVVYAAHDPELDRKVALKLIRVDALGSGGSALAQAWLLREAQAMARVSHPNVVAIHDVGVHEDQVFLSMELVEGSNLQQWLQERPRSWREVLEVLRAAGRGLAAAHAAGLVHRDFKPGNVLIGRDGRVCVSDFGLARLEHGDMDTDPAAPELGEPLPPSRLAAPLTQAGVQPGTPAYMAPEQHLGRPPTSRSDQFSFCAALHVALFGKKAFEPKRLGEALRLAESGEVAKAQQFAQFEPLPPRPRLPGWLKSALRRGLSLRPEDRFPSMEALLQRISGPPAALRYAGRAALLALALSLPGLGAWTQSRWQAQQCSGVASRLEGIWDEPVRARVREAFLATELPYAPDTLSRVEAALDGYASTWVRLSTEACKGDARRQGLPEQVVVRQVYCLERRHSQLRALTELLARGPDAELVPKAVQAVQALPPVEYCADERALTAAVPPPEDPRVRAKAEALQGQVDRLEALHEAGKYNDGLTLGAELLRQAQAAGHAPLQARVHLLMARLRDKAADYKGAEEQARQAMAQAALGKDSVQLAQASGLLAWVVGWRQGRYPEVATLEPAVEALVELAGEERARAEVLSVLGTLQRAMGRYEEARQKNERAVALLEKVLGPEHPEVASALNSLGNVSRNLGHYEQAEGEYRRSLAIRQRALGPEHPLVATSLNSVGNVLVDLGRLEEARADYERALAIRQRALGPGHPEVADSFNNLGILSDELSRYEEARTYHERALHIREKLLGPEHPRVADSLYNLGVVIGRLERHAESLAVFERALAIRRKVLGPEHPEVADTHSALGSALVGLKRWEEARGHLQSALAIQEKAVGAQHPDLIGPLRGLAQLHLNQGRPAQAVAPLERALALAPARVLAEVQFELAWALWESGKDRQRALALATQAREYWQQSGNAPRLAQATEWLASHSRR